MARATLESIQLEAMADPCHPDLQQQETQAREQHIYIVSSLIDLIRQQCEVDWLNYGDDCTWYFFAKAKQRKVESYAFTIQDDHGHVHQGFGEVADILQVYYKGLLGP